MKAKQIAILLALTTMMIAGCGSNTKNADSQTEVSTSTETTDEASSDETDTEETDSNSGETANEATDSQQEAADPGDGNYEDNFAVSHEAAVDFAEKIKSAVAAKALADLVNYPVYIGFKDEGQTVDTKEDFMKLDASELFTDDLLNAVANADESEDVLSPSMAGFNLYSNDASASLTFSVQDGKLGVTGINY